MRSGPGIASAQRVARELPAEPEETLDHLASRGLRITIAAAHVAALASLGLAAAARADGPGTGTPTVAALGDSYISGDAGRWAGNTKNGQQYVDALGSTAYQDTTAGPVIAGCDRSK